MWQVASQGGRFRHLKERVVYQVRQAGRTGGLDHKVHYHRPRHVRGPDGRATGTADECLHESVEVSAGQRTTCRQVMETADVQLRECDNFH